MLKIRLDKRIRYEGHGDSWPDGPPNYFQKLLAKYTTQEASDPDWLRHYFPEHEVRQELIRLRTEAIFYLTEAAKLEVRTTMGWHRRRTVSEQRVLGGNLARLQPSKEIERAEIELKLRITRARRPRAKRLVESHLAEAQYHWHTAMFTITEYLKTFRKVSLPTRAKRGLCDWLSFPELGVRCNLDTIKVAKRHVFIDRRNGRSYRVYQSQLPRNVKKPEVEDSKDIGRSKPEVFASRMITCHLCGSRTEGKEIGSHLVEVERIPAEHVAIDWTEGELYRTDTEEQLATWNLDSETLSSVHLEK